MLKVSVHHATPNQVSPRNVLGRLDIAYARLDAIADYKAVMVSTGLGEHAPVQLNAYPRWSANIWDLVARTVCLGLNQKEAIWPAELPPARNCAFIDDLTAVIEHHPDGLDSRRSTVGIAHLAMRRRKGHYTARFESDLQPAIESTVFVHRPEGLNPWDLLGRAYAWTVQERFELPPRPVLYTPFTLQAGQDAYVPLDTVKEPARTGILRWLHKRGEVTPPQDFLTGPCISEALFVEFLRRAV